MKIYLDLIMILNFFIDLLLLNTVNILLKRNITTLNLMKGAFIGGCSTIFLFFDVTTTTLFIFKLIISIIMILVTFKFKSIKYTLKNLLYLYSSSIILGGFLYFLDLQTNYTDLSLNIIVLIIFCPLILYIYIRQGMWLKTNYSNYYKVTLIKDNKTYNLNAFLDTGNKLTDIYSNKPVILIDKKIDTKKFFYIPYQGINQNGIIKCFKAEKLIINNKTYKKVIIGILEHKIKIDGIDCLLNYKLREDLC